MSSALTATAPAPSPKSTQVPLSVQSISLLNTSDPIIKAVLYNPLLINAWAVFSAYTNPVHAALMS